ncbi:LytR C-terminal domain-containing protein, partial [Patescibacteria group bacterium]|nr:LytR C-terminal domain-containing protein [Patescibacteria group bacterium]
SMKMPSKKVLVISGVIALVVCTSSLAIYFYLHARELEKRPAADKQNELIQQTISAVSKLIALPAGEQPTVATISDPEKLKGQPFFASSVIGDKVLVYQGAKKAILYRPSENKIIEVSSITISDISTQSATQKQEIRVVLYNGTTVTGLTKKYETTLKNSIPTAVVVDRDNAKSSTYETSLFIDLTGTKEAEAKELASKLGISYGVFPDGEVKPTGADFLIIVGADNK